MIKLIDEWWKSGIIYQIYPRSFADSNNDGIGDLRGIINKLDYLKWLNIEAIWLSPFFKSPMKDFGYDVSDFKDVDPIFGTMEDFNVLLRNIKQMGMKLILDLVSNHTSIDHPWFKDSRKSKNNYKRDWYYWRDAKEDGSPPNNWKSISTGESAWSLDKNTNQYFLHTFNPCQPDLNWRNQEVRKEMLSTNEILA
ncbi:MAG: alpha-amylase family glycosyl hydrolase [Candidatus Heimdallarchaeota archaeon]